MTKAKKTLPSRMLVITTAATLAACAAIKATPYVWRDYISNNPLSAQTTDHLQIDSEGNSYQLFEEFLGDEDFHFSLRKFSSDGVEQWRHALEVPNVYYTLSMQGDNPVVTTGDETSTRYASDGSVLWSCRLIPENAFSVKETGTPSGMLYITYRFPYEPELTTIAVDASGTERWSYTFINTESSWDSWVFPASERASGNVVLLNKKSNQIFSSVIDASGNVLSEEVIQEDVPNDSNYYVWLAKSLRTSSKDIILTLPNMDGDTHVLALNDDGTVRWRKKYEGEMQCSEPGLTKVSCLQKSSSQSRIVHWLTVDDGATAQEIPINYGLSTNVYAYGAPEIFHNGIDKWIVAESVAPDEAKNALDALNTKQFYVRFHVYSETGAELKTITMNPGNVNFVLDSYGTWRVPVFINSGDSADIVRIKDNSLIIAGSSGGYFSAYAFVTAYSLE